MNIYLFIEVELFISSKNYINKINIKRTCIMRLQKPLAIFWNELFLKTLVDHSLCIL